MCPGARAPRRHRRRETTAWTENRGGGATRAQGGVWETGRKPVALPTPLFGESLTGSRADLPERAARARPSQVETSTTGDLVKAGFDHPCVRATVRTTLAGLRAGHEPPPGRPPPPWESRRSADTGPLSAGSGLQGGAEAATESRANPVYHPIQPRIPDRDEIKKCLYHPLRERRPESTRAHAERRMRSARRTRRAPRAQRARRACRARRLPSKQRARARGSAA